MANDKIIEEIANKLNSHASQVNPQMWSAIQSQIGAATTGSAAATGAMGAGKVAAIVIGVTAISVASYFVFNATEDKTKATVDHSVEKSIVNENNESDTKLTSTQDQKEEITQINRVAEIKEEKAPVKEKQIYFNEEEEPQKTQVVETWEIQTPMVKEPLRKIEKTNPATELIQKESKQVVEKKETTPPVDKTLEQLKKAEAYTIKKLPNTFTPNGDGVNDYFEIESEGLINYSLVVMDINNKVVWQTKDTDAKWDGRDMEGNKVPKGNYVYFLAAQDANGNPIGKHERLTIQF